MRKCKMKNKNDMNDKHNECLMNPPPPACSSSEATRGSAPRPAPPMRQIEIDIWDIYMAYTYIQACSPRPKKMEEKVTETEGRHCRLFFPLQRHCPGRQAAHVGHTGDDILWAWEGCLPQGKEEAGHGTMGTRQATGASGGKGHSPTVTPPHSWRKGRPGAPKQEVRSMRPDHMTTTGTTQSGRLRRGTDIRHVLLLPPEARGWDRRPCTSPTCSKGMLLLHKGI